jgi:hypothetical protein
MEAKKCPINNGKCCRTDCAWFIENVNESGQKELDGCAIKLLALAKYAQATASDKK